ncbi:hypothetical protein [Lacinutrix sp. Hel_I_90]|uniref:hypothetical protein n=1 Tax=Lacinutrix sp. Hel_I_90 TaxID=1249999 RepID=UPI0005CB6E69|nr:hypothetical protein [Lacinutrix sp. Hel_I_90]
MKTKSIVNQLMIILLLVLTINCDVEEHWGWKRSPNPNDVMDFLNGEGAYSKPVKDARISVVWKDNYYDFIIHYSNGENSESNPGWGWKLATTIEDAYNFVNTRGRYTTKIKDFKICGVWKNNHPEYYIFYKTGQIKTNWGWKLATNLDDAKNFLNAESSYTRPVKLARIASIHKGSHTEYYIFYQFASAEDSISNFLWKKSFDPDDVMQFLNGTGEYGDRVKGYDICAVENENRTEYIVFHNKGTKLWLTGAIENERFVKDEPIELKAFLTSDYPTVDSQLEWSSSIDGVLGNSAALSLNHLSVGNHTITVNGYNRSESVSIRIFNDLWELYQAEPSQAEIDRVMNDFEFHFVDRPGEDESWSAYNTFAFDQSSTDPSKIIAIAKIDLLRHQRFSEDSPFTSGISFYEHLKQHISDIYLYLDCASNTGGGGDVRLHRNFSVWDIRKSGTLEDPEACKTPFDTRSLSQYIKPLYLLMHEVRHSESTDARHVNCNGMGNMDPYFENGSGHASAALYLMWVFKYGLYDPENIKTEARNTAMMLLNTRFCAPPSHSNENVQVILDELLE